MSQVISTNATRVTSPNGLIARQEPQCMENFSRSLAQKQRLIGLTGGVGMGKTTVSNYLATTHHLPVLDADLYAREAVQPGSRVLATLVDRYGSSILLADGSLDRRRLGEIVFSSWPERRWLEQQIHPFVRDRLEAELQVQSAQPIVVLVIPLLFEAQMTDLVTEIWVVQTGDEQQWQRLMERDRLPADQIEARINSQMAIAQKIQRADVVLDNSSTPANLFQQIDQALHNPQQATTR